MSKPKKAAATVAPMKATSLRDSLAKTVRLLTRSGIEVQFRGHQPYVASVGNKAVRLVLPELNDNAPPELIEAIHGFLDHEVGHIYYTPFARASAAGQGSKNKAGLLNLIEDIRLEKLLPRDLPGTKENLERMYEKAMPMFFGPPALKAHEANNPSQAFNCCFIVGLRALAGQKAFQQFMDDNDLWQYLKPLLVKMPNLSRMLRDLEDYDDVLECVDAIIAALKPPVQEPKDQPDEPEDDEDDQSPPPQPGDQDCGDEPDDDGDNESDDGEGHGDGEGTDDGEDDEDAGDCAGGEGDDDGDASGDDQDGGDDAGDEEEGEDGSHTDAGAAKPLSGADGKNNKTLTEALKMLEATPRKAIVMYKKHKKSVAEIATAIGVSEDEAVDLLRNARRKLSEILNA